MANGLAERDVAEARPVLVVLNKLVKTFGKKSNLPVLINLNSAIVPSFKAFCKKYVLHQLVAFSIQKDKLLKNLANFGYTWDFCKI